MRMPFAAPWVNRRSGPSPAQAGRAHSRSRDWCSAVAAGSRSRHEARAGSGRRRSRRSSTSSTRPRGHARGTRRGWAGRADRRHAPVELRRPRTDRRAAHGLQRGRPLEPGQPVRLQPDDFEVVEAEQRTEAATALLLDLSFSMPLRGHFIHAKKMALALHALIEGRYPHDTLYLIGFSDYARQLQPEDLTSPGFERVYGTNMQHAFVLAEPPALAASAGDAPGDHGDRRGADRAPGGGSAVLLVAARARDDRADARRGDAPGEGRAYVSTSSCSRNRKGSRASWNASRASRPGGCS